MLLLRIDDTDASRAVEGGEEAILGDLGLARRRDRRGPRSPERARRVVFRGGGRAVESGKAGAGRRRIGSPSPEAHVASSGRHRDLPTRVGGGRPRARESRTSSAATTIGRTSPFRRGSRRARSAAAGGDPPRPDPRARTERSSRSGTAHSSVADLREAGFPAAAVRAYLDELGLPEHDVQLDLSRLASSGRGCHRGDAATTSSRRRRRAGRGRPGAARRPYARRGTRVRAARARAASPSTLGADAGRRSSASASCALRRRSGSRTTMARAIVRELKAVGGDLHALRLALTGARKGPELAAVLAALSREEAVARADRARARRLTTIARCACTTRSRADCATFLRRRGRSGCTPAARPCTSASTSATPCRSSSRCGSGSWLGETGYETKLVINITDINDKIYDAASGASAQLAADATRWYVEDTDRLGLGRPDVEPTAVETVPDQIAMIDGADRARVRVRVGRRRLLPRRPISATTAVSAVSDSTRSRSRSRTRARRMRATSRSGRRTSRARTRRGSHRGGAADPAGTSSAR